MRNETLPNECFLKKSLTNPIVHPSMGNNNCLWSSKLLSLVKFVYSLQELDWDPYTPHNPNLPIMALHQLMSNYDSSWVNAINKNYITNAPNKLKSYSSFKSVFEMENYIMCMNKMKRRQFTKLRISSHHLAIETGRYTRPITPRNERFCKSCTLQALGDEFHFMLICPKFDVQRNAMFQSLSEFTSLVNQADHNTFSILMNYCHGDSEVAKIICEFVHVCFSNI